MILRRTKGSQETGCSGKDTDLTTGDIKT